MDSVTQKHRMSCGLACVALITKVPYELLVKSVTSEQLNDRGFYCPELVKLLCDNGFKYAYKKLPEAEQEIKFRIGDIVFVGRSKQLPFGHFLAKTLDGWMDPWINLPEEIDVSKAKSGFRTSLPGKAEYLVYPLTS